MRPIVCHKFIWLLKYIPINFMKNVPLGTKDLFGTLAVNEKKKFYVGYF